LCSEKELENLKKQGRKFKACALIIQFSYVMLWQAGDKIILKGDINMKGEKYPRVTERLRLAVTELEKFEKWTRYFGPIGYGLVFTGGSYFVMGWFIYLIGGVIEEVFIHFAIAGIVMGLGCFIATVISNRLSVLSLTLSIGLSNIHEPLEKISDAFLKHSKDESE